MDTSAALIPFDCAAGAGAGAGGCCPCPCCRFAVEGVLDIDDACDEVVADNAGLGCGCWRYALAFCLHLGRRRRGLVFKKGGTCAIKFDTCGLEVGDIVERRDVSMSPPAPAPAPVPIPSPPSPSPVVGV